MSAASCLFPSTSPSGNCSSSSWFPPSGYTSPSSSPPHISFSPALRIFFPPSQPLIATFPQIRFPPPIFPPFRLFFFFDGHFLSYAQPYLAFFPDYSNGGGSSQGMLSPPTPKRKKAPPGKDIDSLLPYFESPSPGGFPHFKAGPFFLGREPFPAPGFLLSIEYFFFFPFAAGLTFFCREEDTPSVLPFSDGNSVGFLFSSPLPDLLLRLATCSSRLCLC